MITSFCILAFSTARLANVHTGAILPSPLTCFEPPCRETSLLSEPHVPGNVSGKVYITHSRARHCSVCTVSVCRAACVCRQRFRTRVATAGRCLYRVPTTPQRCKRADLVSRVVALLGTSGKLPMPMVHTFSAVWLSGLLATACYASKAHVHNHVSSMISKLRLGAQQGRLLRGDHAAKPNALSLSHRELLQEDNEGTGAAHI